MFDPADDGVSDRALREGLYDLPTPEISADFDARIQSALLRRAAWWHPLWIAARPALPAVAWSLIVMLLLLHAMQSDAIEKQTPPSLASAYAAYQKRLSARPADPWKRAPEETLENLDLTYASLSFFSRPLHRNTDKSG